MLVSLDNTEIKRALFKNIKNLGAGEDFKNVKINKDPTKADRELEEQLWEEAKRKTALNPSGEFT